MPAWGQELHVCEGHASEWSTVLEIVTIVHVVTQIQMRTWYIGLTLNNYTV